MRKLDLFQATRSFSDEVAMMVVKTLWRAEFKAELAEAIESELASIAGLENCRGSVIMTDTQIDAAVDEKRDLIASYKDAYAEVVSEWVRIDYPPEAKALYKKYKAALDEGEVRNAFVEFLQGYGLAASADCELVQSLYEATLGDSAGSNVRSLVTRGVASIEKRSRAEFLKIVYRRLFDAMVQAGTIRIGDHAVKSGTETIDLVIEVPSLTKARYEKKSRKQKNA